MWLLHSVSSSTLTCWPLSIPTTRPQSVLSFPTKSMFKPTRLSFTIASLRAQVSDQIAQIVHNKVLISAGVSAAIGQLSKPFTSVFLYGKDFDIKTTIQAGGFPSTHSSAVVAVATCLGLERGFSDSVFGLSVVYAGLVMYDSQGVRREVGIHARTLNEFMKAKTRLNPIPSKDVDDFDSQPGTSLPMNYLSDESGSFTPKESNKAVLVSMSEKEMQKQFSPSELERTPNFSTLKESIGHTEIEVAAGALLGFLVSLAVNNLV